MLAGLYDLNSEFYVSDTSSLFLHPALGIGTDFSQSGQNGPSIFPTASLAIRAKAELTPDFYLRVAALDGVPGDPNNPRGTHIQLKKGDGTLVVAEAGYMRGDHQQVFISDRERDEKSALALGKYAFGVWHYSLPFDDLTAVDGAGNPIKQHNQGIYFLAEQALYHETNEPSQGLAVFLRLGVANNDVNRFDQCFYVGAVYTGPIEGRDTDQIGLTYGSARNSSKYMAAQSSAGTPAEKSESVWELSYRSQLTPWLAVQPDFQYITHPDTNPQLGNATVLGIRFEMSLHW